MARQAQHFINKFKRHNITSHYRAVNEAMTGFKGRFHPKQLYMAVISTKSVNVWGVTIFFMVSCQSGKSTGVIKQKTKNILLGKNTGGSFSIGTVTTKLLHPW
jgi:hypothetical protein